MSDATGPRRASPLMEFTAAVIFLTRIPIPWRGNWPADLAERAFAWFPLVGGLIGAAGGVAYWAFSSAGLPPWLSAACTVAALVWLTGALHEDGLADVADGLGGGRDREQKLSIMKDSRIGTYGAAALILSFAMRIGALAAIAEPRAVALALIGAHAFSRGLLPALKAVLPDARSTGASASQGRPNNARALVAAVIGISLAATALGKLDPMGGGAGLLILAVSAASASPLIAMARRQLGGITGDVLGASQQVSELTFLLALVGALSHAGL